MVERREEGGAEELECGICCMPYDRCGRAPRRLGGARGSWKPSRCRHVLCSACVCQLAREGWWEEVTCPYCRAVTSLRERGNFLVAGVRRGSCTLTGGARRRLVLPPIDAELWQRVLREEERRERAESRDGEGGGSAEEEEAEGDDRDHEQGRLWRALKRFLKGGPAHAQSGAGRRRRSAPPPARRQPINPEPPPPPPTDANETCTAFSRKRQFQQPPQAYGPEMKDLALVTCYVI